MSAIEANPAGWFDVLSRQPGASVHDGWVVTDVPFALCNSCFFPRWGEDADARIDEVVEAGRARGVPQLWWLGESSTPVDLPERLRARGLDLVVEELPGMELPLSALPDVREPVALRTSDVALIAEPFCSAFGVTDDAWSSVAPALAASRHELRHWVVRDGGRSLAAASTLTRDGVTGLYNVSVVPDARGRGLGEAVSVAALAGARDEGAGSAILHASTDGLPIYERLGFVETARVRTVATVML